MVYVVDDDEWLRDALARLLRSAGHEVQAFGTAGEFVATSLPDEACCLVLDVRLPGSSGLDFQDELARSGNQLPIIFMTGHGDIPMSVRAMKAGAVEFLTKPMRDDQFLAAVEQALERDRKRHDDEQGLAALRDRFETLTSREREVFACVATGLLNKQVADVLGISERTVKVHRGQVTRKLAARSIADLVRISDRLGVRPPGPGDDP